jgi:hypothetical protein
MLEGAFCPVLSATNPFVGLQRSRKYANASCWTKYMSSSDSASILGENSFIASDRFSLGEYTPSFHTGFHLGEWEIDTKTSSRGAKKINQ